MEREDLAGYRFALDEASEEVWFEIIERCPKHLRNVAMNKNLPVTVIELLSTNQNEEVRYQIANKRATPSRILEKLASDDAESVRMRVVYNPKVTVPILKKLLTDESVEIRKKASEILSQRLW